MPTEPVIPTEPDSGKEPLRFKTALHPYTQVRQAGPFLFVSGQLGVRDRELVPGGVGEQARQALANLREVLSEVGAGLEHVVRTTVYLAHVEDRRVVDPIYRSAFFEPRPARTCIGVSELPFGALVEFDATAYLPDES